MLENQITQIISVDEFIKYRSRHLAFRRCPSDFGFKEVCGLSAGFFDCKTCWEIALKNIKEVEVVYQIIDFKFKE